jgi:cyclophilin family peptidyl-prolyl cis-trans isomerase
MKKILFAISAFLILSMQAESTTICFHIPDGFVNQKKPDGIYAGLKTNKGLIILRLDYKKAPLTVANFIGLAEGTIKNASYPAGVPFYNGSIWHRVVKGHVIQGGSPAIDKAPEKEETSATGYVIPNEISDLSHNKAGMLGMANSGPHTNTCQFYITLGDRSYLDGNYTLFGEVVQGMDVVNNIIQGDTIKTISIIRDGDEAKNFVVNDASFKVLLEKQWSKVNSEEKKRNEKDEKFITDNYKGLILSSTGLRYRILTPGSGSLPSENSEMTVSYTGRLINGSTFSGTNDGGKPAQNALPVEFLCNAGTATLVKGIKESLMEMKKGEKRLLIIPSDLAYGENGFYARDIPGKKRFVISPRETLIIELTLISFK